MAHPLTHLTHGIPTRRPFHPAKTARSHCRFGDLEPELQQLTMYAWGAHSGFSLFIRRMSSRSSRLTLGLPGRR